MTKKTIILTFLVFILALFARCYLMNIKQGLHTDETFAFLLSTNNKSGINVPFEYNQHYTALDLKKKYGKENNDIKSIVKDIKDIRTNAVDKLNPTLYYSLIRISQYNLTGDFDLNKLIERAFFLNLLIFILSFFIMIKLLNLLDIEKKYIPFFLLVAFLNTCTLSIFIFIKPYILQEFAFLFLTYVFVLNIKNADNFLNIKNILLVVLSLTIALLSGYFSLIYISLLSVAYIAYCLKTKHINNILYFAGFLLLSFICVFIIYPDYFYVSSISEHTSSKTDILNYISGLGLRLILFFSTYLFYLPIILIVLYCIFQKKDKKGLSKLNLILWIVILNLIFAILTYIATPNKILRYMSPAFPLISLIIPYLITNLKNRSKIFLIGITCIVYILGFIYSTKIESIDSAVEKKYPYAFYPNIENTFINTNCRPIAKAEVPIIIFTEKAFKVNNVVPYMKNSQSVMISNYEKPVKLQENFIVLFDKDYIILPKNYEAVQTFHCQRFEGYELKKAE